MDYTSALGYLASLLVMVGFLPQAWQVIKTKSVEDVSLATYAILLSGAVAWTTYGLLQNDWPIVLTNTVLFVVQGVIVFYKLKYSRQGLVASSWENQLRPPLTYQLLPPNYYIIKAPIIVLEGLDACGKSTQTELLLENLAAQGLKAGWKRFPGYENTTAGKRIAAYLRGELGNFHDIDPKQIASLYAADRLAQIEEVETLRDENEVVIFDRGVTSNLIYTPARGENVQEQEQLEKYVETLEYDVFGFPRESLVIFLEASREARDQIHAAKGRTTDLHESDDTYLQKVREVALQRCDKDFRWQKINVDRGGELRRRDDIGEEILGLVLEKLQKKG